MLTPRSKANVENLDSFGVPLPREIDTTSRKIISASPEKAAILQIHTDSSMKLRIRLLENMPETEPELLNEMHISAYSE